MTAYTVRFVENDLAWRVWNNTLGVWCLGRFGTHAEAQAHADGRNAQACARASCGDVSLCVTFDPLAPASCTLIASPLEHELSADEWIGLCESAAARLALYAHDYRAAIALDLQEALAL